MSNDPDNLRRLAEAAAWRVYLSEHDIVSSEAFEASLAADAENKEAWERVDSLWATVGEYSASPELIAARHAALGDAKRVYRSRWLRLQHPSALAAAVVLAFCMAAGAFFWSVARTTYSTELGERRTVVLRDGSRLSLDSATRVRVHYSTHARELELLRGQARFDVAHDTKRPFSVTARGEKIVATGTAFNVDLPENEVLVTLLEGRIVVLDVASSSTGPAERARPLELHAGEQMIAAPLQAPKIKEVNLEQAVAWQNGQVVVENEPLSSVVSRLNRYTQHRVVIADQATADLRISGVFNTGNMDGFIEVVTRYLPVRATSMKDGSIRLGTNKN
jgi:transmembrane sensor